MKGTQNMSFSPIPKFSFDELTDISPEFLSGLGVKFLMLDLDNTIAAYNENFPSKDVSSWAGCIKGSGIELFIISNSMRKKRVEAFTSTLDVGVIMNAHKPSPNGVLQAMEDKGYRAESSALIGDQIFTDTLAANRAGVVSIIVRPKQLTNPFLAIRFAAEKPFRAMCKNISRKSNSGEAFKRTARQ